MNAIETSDCPESPAKRPVYNCGMKKNGFFETYFKLPYFHQFKDFSGCASRKDFWMAWLAMQIINIGLFGLVLLLSGLGGMTGMIVGVAIISIISLILIVPSLALTVRRLRDAGKSPYMIFIAIVPLVGYIVLLIFLCLPSAEKKESSKVSFTMLDWIIMAVCAVLLGSGVYFSFAAMDKLDDDMYEVEELDSDMSSYNDLDPYEVESIEVESIDEDDAEGYGHPLGVNLLDLCADTDHILSGMNNSVNAIRYGSEQAYLNTSGEWGSTSTPLSAVGYIGENVVRVKCYITEDGELHGRYHNENGIDLDFNGYLDSEGVLRVQLGHDSEKSEWTLHYVKYGADVPPGGMLYEGTWGRSNKASGLIFMIDGD